MNARKVRFSLAVVTFCCFPPLLAETVPVMMQSEPPGARVTVDDAAAPSGTAPCVVELTPGDHKACFEMDGFKPDVKLFTAKAGATVKGVLTPLRALITVKSIPAKAAVFIDGTDCGKTPVTGVQVEPGDHEVGIELDGYAAFTKSVALKLGDRITIDAKLQKAEGAAGQAPPPEGQPGEKKPAAEAPSQPAKPQQLIDVSCWVCEGAGVLKTMGCPNCQAKGIEGINTCGKCQGAGRIPVTCNMCKGAGTIPSGGKQSVCTMCNGKGAPPCPVCRGTGKIKKPNPEASSRPTQTCPSCNGTGREMHFKCRFCDDRGMENIADNFRVIRIPCHYCKGAKEAPPPCSRCNGAGVIGQKENAQPCPQCAGTGQAGMPCTLCKGAGWVPAPK